VQKFFNILEKKIMFQICESYINQLRRMEIQKQTFFKTNVLKHFYNVFIKYEKKIIYIIYAS